MNRAGLARENARRGDGKFGTQLRDEVELDLSGRRTRSLAEVRSDHQLTVAWAGTQLADVDLRIATEDVESIRAGKNWPWKNARLRGAQARLDHALSQNFVVAAAYDAYEAAPQDPDLTPAQTAERELAQAASRTFQARVMLNDADNDREYAVERRDEKLAERRVAHLKEIAATARIEEDRLRTAYESLDEDLEGPTRV